MSELMTPIPFRELMTWITTEYRRDGAVFGVHKPYKAGMKKLPIFGETIETPFGPAAGPNTQLAQNIIAGYFAGARFFELKTVQKMDGADLTRARILSMYSKALTLLPSASTAPASGRRMSATTASGPRSCMSSRPLRSM